MDKKKILTTSQLTFVDITDQRQLSAFLSCNFPTTQTVDGETYNPSWADENNQLIITPHVYIDNQELKEGFQTSWQRKDGSADPEDVNIGQNEIVENNQLKITSNILGSTSGILTYICNITYRDGESGTDIKTVCQMTYTLLKKAEDARSCFISGPQVFKYDTQGIIKSDAEITLNAIVQGTAVKEWQYYNNIQSGYVSFNPAENGSALVVSHDNIDIFDDAGVAKIKLCTNDSSVYDIITITKIYDGLAYTVILDNESHIFPGTDKYALQNSNVKVGIVAYQGSKMKNVKITKVGNNTSWLSDFNECGNEYPSGMVFKVTDNDTQNATVEFKISTSTFSKQNGSIPIIMSVDGIEFTKYFSWSVSYVGEKGADGSGACSVSIEASSQIFKSSDGTSYNPSTITLTPHTQNLPEQECTWSYRSYNDSDWIGVDVNNNDGLTLGLNNILTIPSTCNKYGGGVTSIVFKCTFCDTNNNEYVDTMTIAKLSDGQSASAAYTVVLGNEMQCIGTDDKYYPLTNATFECPVIVYEGQTQLEYVSSNSQLGEGKFSIEIEDSTLKNGIEVNCKDGGIVEYTVKTSNTINATGDSFNILIHAEKTGSPIPKTISYAPVTSGTSPIFVEVQATNGGIFYNHAGNVELKVTVYEGIVNITKSCELQWYKYTSDGWKVISDATEEIYNVNGEDVVNIQTYKCVVKYSKAEDNQYEAVCTVQDKSDPYTSDILTLNGNMFKNGQGGSVAYVVVRQNGAILDELPNYHGISVSEPSGGSEGHYYWSVNHAAKEVKLKRHNGISWQDADDDPYEFNYIWSLMDKDGNAKEFVREEKVIYLSADDIDVRGTLQCDVSVKETSSVNMFGNSIIHDEDYVVANDEGGNVEIESGTATDDGAGNVTIN